MSRLFLNGLTILFVLFLGKQFGALIIAVGYLAGTIFQLIYLLIKIRLKILNPFNIKFESQKKLVSVFGFSMLSIILIEIISQLYSIFDRYFYNEISSGGIAALNYAQTIFLLPIGIFSAALSTVIFPKIAASLRENAGESAKYLLQESSLVTLALFTPISFIFFFYPNEIISLVYLRGKFNQGSVLLTATALELLSFSIIFYGIYAVINKIFYSLSMIKALFTITVFGLTVKVIFNFLLVKKLGHNGLALATSLSFIFFFLTSAILLNHKLKMNFLKIFLHNLFVMIFNGLICLTIVQVISEIFFIDLMNFIIVKLSLYTFLFWFNLFIINHRSIILLIDSIGKIKYEFFAK